MRNRIPALLLVAAALVFSTCAKDSVSEAPQPAGEQPPEHSVSLPAASHWRYFSASGGNSLQIKDAGTISEIPATEFRPWTEAVRVVDCGLSQKDAVFLINKCGLCTAERLRYDAHLPVGHDLFLQASAGDLYNVEGNYFIRVYQNSVFLPQNEPQNKYFLLRTGLDAESYSPAADVANLHLPKEAQCKALEKIDDQWYASFKADTGTGISFFYIKCNDFSVFTRDDAFKYVEHISAEDFRTACQPVSYEKMPDMLKNLADKIENDTDVYLRVFTEKSAQGLTFLKRAQDKTDTHPEEKASVNAYALYYPQDSGTYRAAILLPDGTLLLNADGTDSKELRLPLLPKDFNYTAFYLSDTSIVAAWEETVFYEVGRAGIFTADLEELDR